MVMQKQANFRRYVFSIVCGWNPEVGVYIAEVDGRMLPRVVKDYAILAARLGRLTPGVIREYYCDGEMIRLITDRPVCDFTFDSKSRRSIRVHQVYGPLRGN